MFYHHLLGKKIPNFKVIEQFQRGEHSFRMRWPSRAIFSAEGMCRPQVAGEGLIPPWSQHIFGEFSLPGLVAILAGG